MVIPILIFVWINALQRTIVLETHSLNNVLIINSMAFQDVQLLISLKTIQDFVYLYVPSKLMTQELTLMETIQHGNVLLYVLLENKIHLLTTPQ